jgi:hypothetical protein
VARARRTTQPARGPSRWYPQRKDFESYQAWDTHYRAFQRIYELQDQVAALAKTMQESVQASGKASPTVPTIPTAASNQVSASHILGYAVKTGVLTNGQVLTYDAQQGQLVFM